MDLDLTKKGSSANVDTNFTELLAKLAWNGGLDFDLAAAYKDDADKWNLIFFNNMGDLNAPPFMKLSKDAGVGDQEDAGGNEEVLTIAKLDGKKKIHLIVWDFGAIQHGIASRFADSNVSITLVDNNGQNYPVVLDAGDLGANVACIATVVNGPTGAKVENTSVIGTLKNFATIEDLMGALNLPM